MPRRKQARRTSVKDIRSILRLTHEHGLSVRAVSERLKISKTSVSTYLLRAREVGLWGWPLPPGCDDDAALEELLFRRRRRAEGDRLRQSEGGRRQGPTLSQTFAASSRPSGTVAPGIAWAFALTRIGEIAIGAQNPFDCNAPVKASGLFNSNNKYSASIPLSLARPILRAFAWGKDIKVSSASPRYRLPPCPSTRKSSGSPSWTGHRDP